MWFMSKGKGFDFETGLVMCVLLTQYIDEGIGQ